MVYWKWLVFMPVSALMSALSRLLAPILPLFANKEGWLPSWLFWFQTPDNGLDGDRGHKARWPRDGIFWTYCRRVAWLMRNAAYGFDETVCGVQSLPTDELIERGNTEASDKNGVTGTCHRWLFRGEKLIAFHYYRCKHYRFGRLSGCIRISMGWKLWNPSCLPKQYTVYFNPLKKLKWDGKE